MTTTYFNGDLCEYTGRTDTIHGGLFYELRYLEGIHEGRMRWTQLAPGQHALPREPAMRSPRVPQL